MKNFIKYFLVFSIILTSCSDNESGGTQANAVPEEQDCTSTSALVGQSRALRVSNIYGISGTVTIISDCEIEISNFSYNGRGPNVSVYAGINGNFETGVNMSANLNGRRFNGETLNLFLPDGASFNEFNSISIWCFEFDIDFSSASFQ